MNVTEKTIEEIDLSEISSHLNFELESTIPSGIQYKLSRYIKPNKWMTNEIGILNYNVSQYQSAKSLDLKFCIEGKMYCSAKGDCNRCRVHNSINCREKVSTIDYLSFSFSKENLEHYYSSINQENISQKIIRFEYEQSLNKPIPVCTKTRSILDGILNNEYPDTLQNIYVNAQTQMLLIYCMECLQDEKEINTITCRFLANDEDRQKITKARQILIDQIGEPITVKELSKRVAINECYLKKGFKQLFGTTIFDFYQSQRMEHAKYLLYEKGMSVTDVSALLGYSSISHFSTAFKKHTGLKPCELLFR